MARFSLTEVARLTGGRILRGAAGTVFRSFSIDSRETAPGGLFFAIRAERDGHDFVPAAAANGAAGAVVSRPVSLAGETFGLVLVEDTLAALQDLAAAALARRPVKVVGITGSIGKTTTKEFAAALLSSRFKTLKSTANFNNHLGLPLSLLGLEEDDEVAVLEMGMSAPGEIRALARIAPPDVAVITNVAPVHLKFFGSLDEIAGAKREILEGAKAGATAVINGDDPLVRRIAGDWNGPRITFGRDGSNDVRAGDVRPKGLEGTDFVLEIGTEKTEVASPFLNDAHVMNLLAAAAAAHACGVPVADMPARISALGSFAMRGTLTRLPGGALLYDDSYNSSPRALEGVLESLAGRFPSRKIAVLGDMLELGARERDFHRRAGETVSRLGWDVLVAVGPLAAEMAAGAAEAGMERGRILAFSDSRSAAGPVSRLIREGDLILVKGSRGMKMEEIVERLKTETKE
jgi:UDP-N-acetylmuramoyl-tripeptide--D-alanyl-D-alanine ligase